MTTGYKVCKRCGTGWDTHGRYSTCPVCAAGASHQREPTGPESHEIAAAYREQRLEDITRKFSNAA